MSSVTPAMGLHACAPVSLAPTHAASMQCPGTASLATSTTATSCPLVPTRRETSPCQALRPHKRRRMHTSAAAPGAAAAATTTKARGSSSPTASGTASAEGKDGKGGTWMIVGLGNPGANYDNTRHNIGFVVVDRLAKAEGIDVKKLEKSAAVGRGEICGKPVLLVKPVTFMNNSGESVAALAKFYKVPHSRVLVISDDLDMPTATVRLRQKGGHGGHNGLRSIIQHFGNSMEFPRIKIGIGRPSGPMPIASYVLQDFSKAEAAEVAVAVEESVAIVRSILSIGLEKALSGQRA